MCIAHRLEIDIGNNSLTDNGVKYITDAIGGFN